ncbi:MAG TPA: sugar ABC transporter permease [Ktedonobacteraceae bacterium]|nr:sugar ABC transporter permease [Ktedonobacteraceae bacterium]
MALLTNHEMMLPRPGLARASSHKRRWTRYSARTMYLFLAPWILGFLLLTVAPLLYALLLSFTNFDGLSENWHWVGLNNYLRAFQDVLMWASLGRTLLYALITVPFSLAGGLGLALLLNRRLLAVGLFRTLFYVPSVVPVVATALMFKLVFDRDTGLVNALLERLGLHSVAWLIDPNAFFVLVLLSLWGLGGGMVIFLAGLQGIPQELLEAARIDGASAWARFWRVTLPLLSPVLFFQLVVSLIFSLQTLVQPLLLSPSISSGAGAGFTDPTHVQQGNYLFMVNVYAQFFNYQRYGYGSALLWILFLVILAITVLILRSSAFWVYYEIDQDA